MSRHCTAPAGRRHYRGGCRAGRAAPKPSPRPGPHPAHARGCWRGRGMRMRSPRRCHGRSARSRTTTSRPRWTSPRRRSGSRRTTPRCGDAAAAVCGAAREVHCPGLPRAAGLQWLPPRGTLRRQPAVHVGVAVALRGGGLVAPAIMDTADKPLTTLMDDFRALVTRARAGRLRASELAAPTIILTSLGEASVDAVFRSSSRRRLPSSVPARSRSAHGRGRQGRAAAAADAVARADHRVTDGRLGAQFLARIAARLLEPASL